jgi:glycosyltransferase involved in cell wall biosynthesis
MLGQPEISVIIPTYNRSELLRNAVLSLLRQDVSEITFEIIVVDNNSSDDTEVAVKLLSASNPGKVRYIFEQQQGNANARNTGIKNAEGSIIAFVDDDVIVEGNWVKLLKTIFQTREDLSFVGGRVLPQWNEPLPSWLSREHWSPLAVLDYGEHELAISGESPPGLLTANIAFRRNVFDEVGMFSPDLQRVRNGIGSLEDHEFLLRVCRNGKKGIYVPDLVAIAPVDSERLTKEYHRRWHTGHGRFYAIMRDPQWERTRLRIFGVPLHLYRQTMLDGFVWVKNMIRGKRDQAFVNELQLRFFAGFFLQRQKKFS